MILTPLRKVLGIGERPARRPWPRPRFRLGVEGLEHRLVPATLHVGSSPGEFHTIQAAVTAAHSNDTIQVDPGTYTEQVKVDNTGHPRNNLEIEGSGQNSTFIQAPGTMTGFHAIVEVSAAHNVTIEDFTIQGPATGSGDLNGDNLYGVRVDNGGSATIAQNHITKIEDTPFSSLQEGIAIEVGDATVPTTGSATISHNIIDNYQKGGIVVDNTGSSAEIDHNTVTGVGPTAVIAQNGIQVSDGATADVNHNTVSGNVYTLTAQNGFISTGILLFNPGAVTVDHNTASNNNVGIYSFGASAPDIDHNECDHNTFNGIVLDTTTGAEVEHNTTDNNGSGTHDTLTDAVDAGIALLNSTNNTVSHNESDNNNGDGVFADSASTGNVFDHNEMNKNTVFDAEDLSTGSGTAGTANTWTDNQGKTSNPPGLLGHN